MNVSGVRVKIAFPMPEKAQRVSTEDGRVIVKKTNQNQGEKSPSKDPLSEKSNFTTE